MSTEIYLFVMLILGGVLAAGIYLAVTGSRGNKIDSGRRSFITGREQSSDEHALFLGIQIAIQIFGSDELRARLARLIEAEDNTDDINEKRRFLKSIASLLIENQYAWEYGFWDYYSKAETAIGNFNQWKNEIEASMATEPDEMGDQIDRLHRYSDQKEYLVVTIILLIDNRDDPVMDDVGEMRFRPTYTQLTQTFRQLVENMDEDDYWRLETFTGLLEALRALDPRVIERDGIYVYPGSAQDGLSSIDLLGDEGWKYLTDHAFRMN